MADITTKTVSSLTSDSTLSETDAFVYGDAGGNTLKKSALSVLRNALFGAATLPSALATSAKNVIGAINELNTNLTVTTTGVVTLSSGIDYQAWKYGRIVVLKVHNWGKVTLSSGATIATLDTAYRPISDVAWAQNGVDTHNGSITVTTGGAIQYVSWAGTSNYIYAQMTYISAS